MSKAERSARKRLRDYAATSRRGYEQDLRKAARQLDATDPNQLERWLKYPNRFDLKPIGKQTFDSPRPRLRSSRRRSSKRRGSSRHRSRSKSPAKEQCPRSDAEIDAIVQKLLRQWLADIKSGGSNNSVTLGGIKRVLKALDKAKPLKGAVLADLGSGAGIPLIYAALKYRTKGYGIEYDPELVDIARDFAKQACVDHLVTFQVQDLLKLQPSWFAEHKVDAVYSFDGVFLPNVWNQMFDAIAPNPLYGATVSKFKRYWPASIQLIATVPSVALAGGKSSFNFGIWKNH